MVTTEISQVPFSGVLALLKAAKLVGVVGVWSSESSASSRPAGRQVSRLFWTWMCPLRQVCADVHSNLHVHM